VIETDETLLEKLIGVNKENGETIYSQHLHGCVVPDLAASPLLSVRARSLVVPAWGSFKRSGTIFES
jgi:hypothetical protein